MSVDEIDGSNKAHISKPANPREHRSSRRQLLRQVAGASLGLPLAQWKALPVLAQAAAAQADRRRKEPASLPPPASFSPEDEQFLDDLEHSSFLYFWEQANPQTGLIKDRCNAVSYTHLADPSESSSTLFPIHQYVSYGRCER